MFNIGDAVRVVPEQEMGSEEQVVEVLPVRRKETGNCTKRFLEASLFSYSLEFRPNLDQIGDRGGSTSKLVPFPWIDSYRPGFLGSIQVPLAERRIVHGKHHWTLTRISC